MKLLRDFSLLWLLHLVIKELFYLLKSKTNMGLLDFLFNKKNNKISGVVAVTNESQGTDDLFTEVEVLPGIEVPKVFAGYWDKIETTKLPCISIKSTATDDLSFHQSSFGY